jgi:inward rectifier potassium channel
VIGTHRNIEGKGLDDLGLGTKDAPKNLRFINRDGSFNFVKRGLPFFESFNFYHYLVNINWFKFILIIVSGYVVLNTVFAFVYYLTGMEGLSGIAAKTEAEKFYEAFFFSAQSFTTVGYGRISPVGFWSSSLAALESLIGLLCLALATGLLYGRFSRPVAKIMYSKVALIAPFKDMTGFMFRISNKQKNQMQDAEIRVVFSFFEFNNGTPVKKFINLKLEYSKINFFPSAWIVNHPITESSPLYGMTEQDLTERQAEFMILLQGFDDTFSQTVHSRYSYYFNEIVWDAKFKNIYGVDDNGRTTVAMDGISEYEKL